MNDDRFSYKTFRIDATGRTVFFDYEIRHSDETHQLTESLKFPVALQQTAGQLAGLRALHLALGISYYKIFVAPRISHPYQMNAAEADFWNDIWRNGLGEFLYQNKLSPERLATFAPQDGTMFEKDTDTPVKNAAILGIGGGKDSLSHGASNIKLLKLLGLSRLQRAFGRFVGSIRNT